MSRALSGICVFIIAGTLLASQLGLFEKANDKLHEVQRIGDNMLQAAITIDPTVKNYI